MEIGSLGVEPGLLDRALWGRSADERRPGERVGLARCRRPGRARCAGRARRSALAAKGTRGDLALCLALCQESGGITRTRRRTGREKLSASGAPTGSSQLSRFPARAVLAGSVEARGRTAQLDSDRYRSFSVGRNQLPPRDRPVEGDRSGRGREGASVAKGQNSRVVVAERVETASEPLFGYEFRSGLGGSGVRDVRRHQRRGADHLDDHRRQLADDSSRAMRPG
jgi:hypothetical protein